jgi:hypothetical protein
MENTQKQTWFQNVTVTKIAVAIVIGILIYAIVLITLLIRTVTQAIRDTKNAFKQGGRALYRGLVVPFGKGLSNFAAAWQDSDNPTLETEEDIDDTDGHPPDIDQPD